MYQTNPYRLQESIPAQNPFPAASFIRLSLAEMLERFSYYGIRNILSIYLVNLLHLERSESLFIYSLLLMISSLAAIPAGIIGDLLISPVICMIIGLSMTAAGCFVLLMPGHISLISAIILISLGSAIFKVNMLSRLSAIFQSQKRYLDGAYSVLYMAINIGAFLASLVFLGITGKDDIGQYKLAFALAGILSLLALGVIIFEIKSMNNNALNNNSQNKALSASSIISILATLFFAPVYWLIYQFHSNQLMNCNPDSRPDYFINTTLLVALLAGPVFASIWFFTRIESVYKIGLGFVILSILMAINIFVSPCIQDTNYGLMISELLVAIPCYSVIARFAPPRFQGLFFGIIIGSFYFVTRYLPDIEQLSDYFGATAVNAVLLAISVLGSLIFILSGIFLPKYERI